MQQTLGKMLNQLEEFNHQGNINLGREEDGSSRMEENKAVEKKKSKENGNDSRLSSKIVKKLSVCSRRVAGRHRSYARPPKESDDNIERLKAFWYEFL